MALTTAEQTALENEFHTLADQWKQACAFLSSSSAMAAHPAYKAIIAMGRPVVPLLLRELEREPVHWFEALQAITGEDPVSRSDWGDIRAMAAAWLARETRV